MTTTDDHVLGRIPLGEADTSLQIEPPRLSRRRQAAQSNNRLPKGAWVRLRVAGGLIFRSSETIVFDDRRLTYRSSPTAMYGQTLMVRELLDSQTQALHAAIEEVNFEAKQPQNYGRDTMSFELAVRTERRTRMIETFQGLTSEQFQAVIDLLSEYVRIGADEMRG